MRRHAGGRRCGARADASHASTREASGPDRGALRPLREVLAGLGCIWERPSAAGKSGVEPLPAKPEARTRGGNQETRTRGQKSRRGAPRGARTSQDVRQDGKTRCAAWRSTPSFWRGRKERTAYPAPQGIRAMSHGRLRIETAGCRSAEPVRCGNRFCFAPLVQRTPHHGRRHFPSAAHCCLDRRNSHSDRAALVELYCRDLSDFHRRYGSRAYPLTGKAGLHHLP